MVGLMVLTAAIVWQPKRHDDGAAVTEKNIKVPIFIDLDRQTFQVNCFLPTLVIRRGT